LLENTTERSQTVVDHERSTQLSITFFCCFRHELIPTNGERPFTTHFRPLGQETKLPLSAQAWVSRENGRTNSSFFGCTSFSSLPLSLLHFLSVGPYLFSSTGCLAFPLYQLEETLSLSLSPEPAHFFRSSTSYFPLFSLALVLSFPLLPSLSLSLLFLSGFLAIQSN